MPVILKRILLLFLLALLSACSKNEPALSAILFKDAQAATTDDPLSLLRKKNYSTLEKTLSQVQSDFEAGKVSEFELRQTYRPFYSLDEGQLLPNVEEWKTAFPNSYPAYLIRGTWYKAQGNWERGTDAISNTAPERIEVMEKFFSMAEADLQKSRSLTKKPYLSVFHLLDISMTEGDKEKSLALVNAGNRMLPANILMRNRYMGSLKPRWGGSYDEMEQFIARSKKDGATRKGLMELTAIMYDDMGLSADEDGDKESAVKYFIDALELSTHLRSDFVQDFLSGAEFYKCRLPELKKYCI